MMRKRHIAWATALLYGTIAILAVAAAGKPTADLEGRVRFHGASARDARQTLNAYVGAMGSACCESTPNREPNDPRDFVLFVEGLVDSSRVASTVPELAQVNQQFEPHVLAVPVGTEVSFPNRDPLFHNVFSYSRTKRFDLGKYGEGKTRTVKFDTPGLVQVFCEIHSNMNANILVVDSSFVTQPDESGSYRLRGLPVGTHVLSIWHPELGMQQRKVQIPKTGAQLDLDF